MAATKARAVSWPTPGIAMSLRQASDAVVMRIVADSIGLCGRAPAHYPMLKK